MTLTYVKTNKNVVFYQLAGFKGSVRFLTSHFSGSPDQILTVEGNHFAQPAAPTVKETKEERKARLAAMSPAEKLELRKENARKAKERADRRAAALGV